MGLDIMGLQFDVRRHGSVLLGHMCDDSTLQDRHWMTLERSTTRSFDQASAVTVPIVWTTPVLGGEQRDAFWLGGGCDRDRLGVGTEVEVSPGAASRVIAAAAPSNSRHAQCQCGGSCSTGLWAGASSLPHICRGRTGSWQQQRRGVRGPLLSCLYRVAAAATASVACGLRLGQAPSA